MVLGVSRSPSGYGVFHFHFHLLESALLSRLFILLMCHDVLHSHQIVNRDRICVYEFVMNRGFDQSSNCISNCHRFSSV